MRPGGIFLTKASVDAPFGAEMQAYRAGALGQTMKVKPKFGIDFRKKGLFGLGADILTMDPATQAALKSCSEQCDKTYGLPSGSPNLIGLTACFASCNAKYPPTVTAPPALAPALRKLPATLPTLPTLTITPPAQAQPSPYEPLVPPAPATSNTKWLILGGAVLAAAGVGLYVYKKRKG